MTSKGPLGWRKLFLILTALPCCRSLQVSIPVREYEVARGSDTTLTCSFIPARPDFPTLILKWEAFPDNNVDPAISVANYFLNNPADIAPGYEGRAFLEVDLNKHVSTLRLTKVTMQDNRRFQCSVTIPNDDEGITAATTSLLVLVPPSIPICSIQGKAEYWHDIILTCMSEEGSPEPTYEWRSYSVQNIPREFPPKTTQDKGVLSLFNISREMSGFYICTSTNRISSASCNFTLAVMPGSMNEGSIPAIIGGVLAGLLCLGILIFCCCRKKGKKDKYAEGVPAELDRYNRDTLEDGEQYLDDKSSSKTTQHKQYEDKDVVPQNSYSVGTGGHKFEEDQHSHSSGKERNEGKGSEIGSQDHGDDQHDHYRGSRDRLEYQPDRYGGSRDRLDDKRNYYSGSRERLDDQRDHFRGSRDRLDDRLDDRRERCGGSRDRLDDRRERYGGSRDRLDDHRDRYGGNRDRFDDQRDRYGGSRNRLDEHRNSYGGSPDCLDYNDD
ncbi:cell surface A33 antigen-like [Xiphias gladius]|uniref:cell surface A33 antigen-like n=1 Tax=Xiphias gladius TaxID=8245 RepID=UPI001A991EE4|nr:cell surface A33 antigen-like [Xiphias gladius]